MILQTVLTLQQNPCKNLNLRSVRTPAQSLQTSQPGILVANLPAPHKNEDRKFNVVIYGIKECPQNTSHVVRHQTDLDTLNGAFHDSNIQVDDRSIKDFFALANSSQVTPSLGLSWSNS